MYLHINKNCVIKNDSVIGVFSMENIENTKEYKKLCENLKENIIDLSENQPKTFLLTKEGNKVKGYILKIGVNTIKKRMI